MQIGALTTRSVLTVEPNESLHSAAQAMMERGIGSAVIVTDGKPTGIVTDRESLRAIAQGKDTRESTVSEFVTGRLTTASPSMEMLEAARVMREKGFRHLVVVDDSGSLIGVFSMRDLVVGLLEERSALAGSSDAGSGA